MVRIYFFRSFFVLLVRAGTTQIIASGVFYPTPPSPPLIIASGDFYPTHHPFPSPEELFPQLRAWPIQRAFGWAPRSTRVLDCLQLNRRFVHMKCDGTFLICFNVRKSSSCLHPWRETRSREKKNPLFRQTNAVWSTDTHLHGVVNIKAEHFHIRVFSTFVFG